MFKQAYPDKYLFAGRQGNVFRAFMFQVGAQKETIHRTVPNYLGQLSILGGLFVSFAYLNAIINFCFFDPFDLIDFFYAVQDMMPDIPEEDKFERNDILQYL